MENNLFKNLSIKGYAICKTKKIHFLKKVRNQIYKESTKIYPNTKKLSIENYLDNFHEFLNKPSDLNDFRLKIISKIANDKNNKTYLFKAFETELKNFIGEDLAIQKNINLSVNIPKDLDTVPVHRDSPPGSNFEVALVIPLTNFFKTKNLRVCDYNQTLVALNLLKKNYKKYEKYVIKNAKSNSIRFGSVLAFWSGLVHHVPYNLEGETRWSLNLRFKNIFSPYGAKKFLDFYEPINLSKYTKKILEFQKKINA
jgi:sporadic carbohydrate cluster 2OG-Fe(II) oxygenase